MIGEIELLRELDRAGAGITDAALRQMVAMGIPRDFLTDLYARTRIGVAQVSLGGGGASSGLWEPEGPDRRMLLAVTEKDAVVDVVALSSTARDEWALRTGAGTLLGWDLWLEAYLGLGDRLRVFATPTDWLASGGAGICVLDWSAEVLGMLRGLTERVRLLVDAAAKERMRALLAYGGLPRVEAVILPGRMAA